MEDLVVRCDMAAKVVARQSLAVCGDWKIEMARKVVGKACAAIRGTWVVRAFDLIQGEVQRGGSGGEDEMAA